MPNACTDPDQEHISNPTLDLLADPFRRRLLSAIILAAIGFALLAAGIPFPAQAAGACDSSRDISKPATYPNASENSDPHVFPRPDGKPLAA